MKLKLFVLLFAILCGSETYGQYKVYSNDSIEILEITKFKDSILVSSRVDHVSYSMGVVFIDGIGTLFEFNNNILLDSMVLHVKETVLIRGARSPKYKIHRPVYRDFKLYNYYVLVLYKEEDYRIYFDL